MQVKEYESRIYKEVLKTTKENNPIEEWTDCNRHFDKEIENSNIEKKANTTWENVN